MQVEDQFGQVITAGSSEMLAQFTAVLQGQLPDDRDNSSYSASLSGAALFPTLQLHSVCVPLKARRATCAHMLRLCQRNAGTTQASANQGVVLFDSLRLTAKPGTYTIKFGACGSGAWGRAAGSCWQDFPHPAALGLRCSVDAGVVGLQHAVAAPVLTMIVRACLVGETTTSAKDECNPCKCVACRRWRRLQRSPHVCRFLSRGVHLRVAAHDTCVRAGATRSP